MGRDLLIDELNIGKMIKEIAIQNQVSARKIAEAINRYDGNSDKIFKLDDMYVEDIKRISILLKYNFFKIISDKYLSHIPFAGDFLKQEQISIFLDIPSNSFQIRKNHLKQDKHEIHIGSYIKEIAKKNEVNEQYIADQIGRSQGLISYLYKQKTLKIKLLIKISIALNYNLISEVYLSTMDITFSHHLFDGCLVELNTKHSEDEKQGEGLFTLNFF